MTGRISGSSVPRRSPVAREWVTRTRPPARVLLKIARPSCCPCYCWRGEARWWYSWGGWVNNDGARRRGAGKFRPRRGRRISRVAWLIRVSAAIVVCVYVRIYRYNGEKVESVRNALLVAASGPLLRSVGWKQRGVARAFARREQNCDADD